VPTACPTLLPQVDELRTYLSSDKIEDLPNILSAWTAEISQLPILMDTFLRACFSSVGALVHNLLRRA